MVPSVRFLAIGVMTALTVLAIECASAQAGDINDATHLGNGGNALINDVKAKGYLSGQMKSNNSADGNTVIDSNTVVHYGSAAHGDCNMNVGGTPTNGGKDTVVTAKNIINLCK